MKRVSLVLIFALIISVVVGISCNQEARAQSKPIVAKLNHGYPVKYIRHTISVKFKELVEKATNGRVQIEIFPAGQLYSTREEMKALLMNNVQFVTTIGPNVSSVQPTWVIGQTPLLFDLSLDSIHSEIVFSQSEPFKRLCIEPFEAKGYKFLSLAPVCVGGALGNNVRPIRTLEDCKGLKIRNLGGKAYAAVCTALGMSPMNISSAEIVTALQQGTVDGALSNWNCFGNLGWPVKYIIGGTALTTGGFESLLSNQMFWKSLPADIQGKIMGVIPEFVRFCEAETLREDRAAMKRYESELGGTITTLKPGELEKFREAFEEHVYKKLFYPDPALNELVQAAKAMSKR